MPDLEVFDDELLEVAHINHVEHCHNLTQHLQAQLTRHRAVTELLQYHKQCFYKVPSCYLRKELCQRHWMLRRI